jgi:hypothetical protein
MKISELINILNSVKGAGDAEVKLPGYQEINGYLVDTEYDVVVLLSSEHAAFISECFNKLDES